MSSGPKKPLESVTFASGHEMNVEVGDALADAVIHGNEGALRGHGFFNCPPNFLCIVDEPCGKVRGQIVKGLQMLLRYEKHVAVKKWL